MKKPTVRDFDADFEAALVDEYEGYKRAGRTEDAAAVAKVLQDRFDHDVAPKSKPVTKADAPERADVKAPETAVPPKPVYGAATHPPEDAGELAAKRGPGRPRKA
jgi:hypothetical protein